jgi:hypothetical protein
MHENISVQIFQNAVLSSAVEPKVANLIKFANDDKSKTNATEAFAAAKAAYGVNVKFVLTDPTAESHVYYFDNNGKKVYLSSQEYTYADGILTIKGDDSTAKNYYADFTAVMTSRICAGEHVQEFRVKILGTK